MKRISFMHFFAAWSICLLGAGCARFGYENSRPGFEGEIRLGRQIFPAQQSSIVVALYPEAQVDPQTLLPKSNAEPVGKVRFQQL
ncbi:MAG: hypothetical protein AAGJ35_11175, partial [Myxococcota bacterium]